MIEYQTLEDRDEVLALCLQTHPQKERDFLNFYFEEHFETGKGLLIREDERVVSCMQMHEHCVQFQEKALLCSYLFGVSTQVDYRQRGYMDKLMHFMLDMCGKNYLISFIEAYNPRVYKKYGFETISYRKKFSIHQKDLKVNNTNGVSETFDIEDLVALYAEFAKRFDCFYVRDTKYYEDYIQQIKEAGGKLTVYKNKDSILKGYCVYYEKDDLVEVKEIIYLDSLSLYKLLKYAIGYMPYISLEVSNNERIEKIFKHAIPRSNTSVMARINNFALFNKLYDVDAKNVDEAFKILKKPVLINEKY